MFVILKITNGHNHVIGIGSSCGTWHSHTGGSGDGVFWGRNCHHTSCRSLFACLKPRSPAISLCLFDFFWTFLFEDCFCWRFFLFEVFEIMGRLMKDFNNEDYDIGLILHTHNQVTTFNISAKFSWLKYIKTIAITSKYSYNPVFVTVYWCYKLK